MRFDHILLQCRRHFHARSNAVMLLHRYVMLLTTDYDECSHDDWNDCNEGATCNNTIGSYKCKCNIGYTGDGRQCEGQFCNKAIARVNSVNRNINSSNTYHNKTISKTTSLLTRAASPPCACLFRLLHCQGYLT